MKAIALLVSLMLLVGCATPAEDDLVVVEGDIVVGTKDEVASQARTGFGVAAELSWARWPRGRVPYVIHASLPNPQRVHEAIAHIQERTRLRFVPRTTQTAYIVFKPWAQGYCRSWIGFTGKNQAIDLDPACDKRSVIHEIGHAVGLWHEHTRKDRDSYVKIRTGNIWGGTESNFAKQLQYGQNFGPYDFSSVMHYRAYEFSSNGKPTITRLDGSIENLSNPDGLSQGDISALNRMYP